MCCKLKALLITALVAVLLATLYTGLIYTNHRLSGWDENEAKHKTIMDIFGE